VAGSAEEVEQDDRLRFGAVAGVPGCGRSEHSAKERQSAGGEQFASGDAIARGGGLTEQAEHGGISGDEASVPEVRQGGKRAGCPLPSGNSLYLHIHPAD